MLPTAIASHWRRLCRWDWSICFLFLSPNDLHPPKLLHAIIPAEKLICEQQNKYLDALSNSRRQQNQSFQETPPKCQGTKPPRGRWNYDSYPLGEHSVTLLLSQICRGWLDGSTKCRTLTQYTAVRFPFLTNSQHWLLLTTIFPQPHQLVIILIMMTNVPLL